MPDRNRPAVNLRERFLARPAVYKLFKRVVLPRGVINELVNDHFTVPDGGTVLDLGCGFGDYAQHFAGRTRYLGVDQNERYIRIAQSLNATNGARFMVGDVSDAAIRTSGPYDLVMMSGVLHHLPTSDAVALLRDVAQLLTPAGRFCALEAAFHPDQSLSARLIVAADRGRFVRDEDGYRALFPLAFEHLSVARYDNMLRIPYTHLVLTATTPRLDGTGLVGS